ncbi:ABC transporter permease [Micromonospora chokoriensis]|uniref:ABC transporter permease n=1 Tax=Micromonospora chokoriensis TaxID=356851 RepID=UPI0012FDCD46|nr:ABC transporter permease [Micromonospora chokoriensis]
MAVVSAVMLATTGFCVLTGATTASRLQAVGVVQANYRSAYDILVRPAGSRGELETRQGLVRPNFLSGQFGGLSVDQWRTIQAVEGVDIAAPVAMVGYVSIDLGLPVDLTDKVDRRLRQQLLRLSPETIADRGLTRVPGTPAFVYVTRNRLIPVRDFANDRQVHVYADGTELSAEYVSQRCPAASQPPLEMLSDGHRELVCDWLRDDARSPVSHAVRAYQLMDDGTFRDATVLTRGRTLPVLDRLVVRQPARFSLLAAAVDPDQEARLSGLNHALTSGRYLDGAERPQSSGGEHPVPRVPMLATDRLVSDEQIAVAISVLPEPGRVRAGDDRPALARLAVDAGAALPPVRRALGTVWTDWLTSTTASGGTIDIHDMVTVASPSYDRDGDALRVRPADPPKRLRTAADTERFSPLAVDTALRAIGDDTRADQEVVVEGTVVGAVDPLVVTRGRELTGAPMETFVAPRVSGADQRSSSALGGQDMLPTSSITGYVAAPPQLLTNLVALPDLLRGADAGRAQAPLSAVRVRVAGIDRFDAVGRERVRVVAEEIAARTGLDVDIVLGSSATRETLVLPAGRYGRPPLTVHEMWTEKGVAAVLVRAVDRKSSVLLGMVLITCVLFVGNAVSAAVRDRRRELAILACQGWPARRLAALILGEAGLLGVLAGVAAGLLTIPVAAAVGIEVPWSRVAVALGVAIALTLVAAIVPAVRAAGAYPAAALQPALAPARTRAGTHRTILRMAVTGARRVPGRTALAAVSLAIAVAALTFAVAVDVTFKGRIIGTVLGDGVSLTVREIDRVTVVGLMVFSIAAVADVLYLGVRERATEFAVLQATGWSDGALVRMVCLEGLVIGVLGGVAGGGIALGATFLFAGGITPAMLLVAAGTAGFGVLLAATAGLLPAVLVRGMPARHLADE